MTNTFDAQYGRMGGGLINLVTKSGSNSLHGDAYDILRNKSLDANSWISNLQKQPRGLDTQNDFGALISGPVYIPSSTMGGTRPSSCSTMKASGFIREETA